MAEPLGRQLVFTAKSLRESFEHVLAEAGGSLGTWIVLSALSDTGIVSQSVLASHVHLEGATITHHVDRLEQQGLVRRKLHPADRRVRQLELTAAGARLHAQLLGAAKEFEQRALRGLDANDRASLAAMLERIRSNLEGASGGASGGERGRP